MAATFYSERSPVVANDSELFALVHTLYTLKLIVALRQPTAIAVSSVDPTSSTHAGIWLDERSWW